MSREKWKGYKESSRDSQEHLNTSSTKEVSDSTESQDTSRLLTSDMGASSKISSAPSASGVKGSSQNAAGTSSPALTSRRGQGAIPKTGKKQSSSESFTSQCGSDGIRTRPLSEYINPLAFLYGHALTAKGKEILDPLQELTTDVLHNIPQNYHDNRRRSSERQRPHKSEATEKHSEKRTKEALKRIISNWYTRSDRGSFTATVKETFTVASDIDTLQQNASPRRSEKSAQNVTKVQSVDLKNSPSLSSLSENVQDVDFQNPSSERPSSESTLGVVDLPNPPSESPSSENDLDVDLPKSPCRVNARGVDLPKNPCRVNASGVKLPKNPCRVNARGVELPNPPSESPSGENRKNIEHENLQDLRLQNSPPYRTPRGNVIQYVKDLPCWRNALGREPFHEKIERLREEEEEFLQNRPNPTTFGRDSETEEGNLFKETLFNAFLYHMGYREKLEPEEHRMFSEDVSNGTDGAALAGDAEVLPGGRMS